MNYKSVQNGSSTEQSPTKPIKKNSPKSQKGAKSKRNRSISGSESEESIVQNEIKSLLGDPNEFILPGSLKAAQRDQVDIFISVSFTIFYFITFIHNDQLDFFTILMRQLYC